MFRGNFSSIRYLVGSFASFATTACEENPSKGVGLLSGMDINDDFKLTSVAFYSPNICVAETKKFVRDALFIYNSANQAPSSTLEICATLATEFAKGSVFYDRNDLQDYMQAIIQGPPGAFVCLLGGKSTGKSKLVSALSAKYADSVISVDCRSNPNIVQGLIGAINAKEATGLKTLQDVLTGMIKDAALAAGTTNAVAAFELSQKTTLEHLLGLLVKHCTGKITIIIDEANIALATEGSEGTVAATRQALALFTRLTKQEEAGL